MLIKTRDEKVEVTPVWRSEVMENSQVTHFLPLVACRFLFCVSGAISQNNQSQHIDDN